MGVTQVEKAELTAYQLKGVTQVLFNQWMEEMAVDVCPLDWKKFKVNFLDRFFPLEIRKAKGKNDQGSSNDPPKFNKDKVSNLKPQGGNGGGFSSTTCVKYGRKHKGTCIADTNGFFGCGKSGHKIRYFPSPMAKGRECRKTPLSVLGPSVQKENRFYEIQTRHEQECSPDVGTTMLKVFHFDAYTLLDPGASLSFVAS
ncbi:uncharacterized protein LOC125868494 [Solanum stenotomum]|uniref:uncharacterized protein LOC125868494 n=1 Tax=Solanum stenotomum TaxID=172797 RepID=UPI0020D1426B|nr:uncharacterized protein LOC125868494 [Solanum stenotomum]